MYVDRENLIEHCCIGISVKVTKNDKFWTVVFIKRSQIEKFSFKTSIKLLSPKQDHQLALSNYLHQSNGTFLVEYTKIAEQNIASRSESARSIIATAFRISMSALLWSEEEPKELKASDITDLDTTTSCICVDSTFFLISWNEIWGEDSGCPMTNPFQ